MKSYPTQNALDLLLCAAIASLTLLLIASTWSSKAVSVKSLGNYSVDYSTNNMSNTQLISGSLMILTVLLLPVNLEQ